MDLSVYSWNPAVSLVFADLVLEQGLELLVPVEYLELVVQLEVVVAVGPVDAL
jgi:hypothetical protein